MALSTGAALGIAAGAGLLGWWWLGGFGGSGTGDAAAATAAGSKDGCASGTADGKASAVKSINPSDDPTAKKAAAKFGTNAKAYNDAFDAAYDDCYDKNLPPTKVFVPPTPAPSKAPVATAYLDRFTALDSWLAGSRQGAQDGYIHHIKTIDTYDPNTNGQKVPSAYRAGYKCGFYNAAKKAEAFDGMGSILTPDYLPKDTENTVVSECSGSFGAWYDAHKTDISVAGCSSCGESMDEEDGALVGFLKRTKIAGRAIVGRSARPFLVGGLK